MSSSDAMVSFTPEAIEKIRDLIEERRKAPPNREAWANCVLREDIFRILGCYCTVVYYPLAEEENDGFCISMPVNGEKTHFVYINTAKQMAKQIYAAAHELGHIWRVDEVVGSCQPDLLTTHEKVDAIMNRFAAELLMPEDLFYHAAEKKLEELKDTPSVISERNMFRVISYLMDEYFVPLDAVVIRMEETKILSPSARQQLIKNSKTLEGKNLLENCIAEGGYTKLQEGPAAPKKAVTGFPELLNRVDNEGLFSPQKVQTLRKLLGLPKVEGGGKKISLPKEKETGM